MLRIIIILIATFFAIEGRTATTPLPPNQAFHFSSYYSKDAQQIILEWDIAPGYFLYRDKLRFSELPASKIKIGMFTLPAGTPRHDMLHGDYQVYLNKLTIAVPVEALGLLNLAINYQGCSLSGFCYSPIQKKMSVDLRQIKQSANLMPYVQAFHEVNPAPNESGIERLFSKHSLTFILFSFLGLGILLAFTPCVLPMVPILSGIILGQNKKTNKAKAFRISLAYVLGMALTYAAAGVVIALIGSNLQAELQRPWIIILFSGVFILLAFSLFGFYELQLPSNWLRLINNLSNRQKGGSYFGVFVMGCLSTLIVSPCVSAPLIGVLAYIGQTGDVLLGALALLSLGIGMGIPLLLLGLSADRFLPKAGAWMEKVERFFGIAMLGLAIWMLSRMIPGPVTLFLWSLLCIFTAFYLDIFSGEKAIWRWVSQGLGIAMLIYGVILMLGSVMGNSSPFYPWEQIYRVKVESNNQNSIFIVVKDKQALAEWFAKAKQAQKNILLDFYADWCVSCVAMDHSVFSRSDMQLALQDMIVLRADVTKNNVFDHALLKRFHVVGPPTILFFDSAGRELTAERIVGELNANEFLQHLLKIKKSSGGVNSAN